MDAQSFIESIIITGGIVILWLYIKGLKQQVEIQSNTIKAMDKRLEEAEKISTIYKQFFEDAPNIIDQWKGLYENRQEELINNIKKTDPKKDEQIRQLQKELETVREHAKIIDEIPKLISDLGEKMRDINRKIDQIPEVKQQFTSEMRAGDFLLATIGSSYYNAMQKGEIGKQKVRQKALEQLAKESSKKQGKD